MKSKQDPRVCQTIFFKLLDNLISQGGPHLLHDLQNALGRQLAVFFLRDFVFKGTLRDLFKKVLDVSRSESRRISDQTLTVNLTGVETRQVEIQNSSTLIGI
jgi:hypothetical protein